MPHDRVEAMNLDGKNGNTKRADAEGVELGQLNDYKTFVDKGKGYDPGASYTKIRVHFVYDVKHDGRH